MTHKQECIYYCIDHLTQRNLAHTFDTNTFSHYYRKHNGAWSNAYHVGLNAADMMIANFRTSTENNCNNDCENQIIQME